MNLKDVKAGAIWLIGGAMLGWPFIVQARQSPEQNASTVVNVEGLRLKQAQRRAVEHYPGIQVAELRIEEQEVLKKTAWDLGTTTVYTGKEEFARGREGIETKIAIKQGAVDVFGIAPALKLQQERTTLAHQRLQFTRLQVKQQVSSAWAQAYAAKKIYGTYRQLDSLFAGIQSAAEIRFEVEDISRLEYLALKNQANAIRLDKDQAYADYLSALQQLNGWFVSDTLFDVADAVEVPLDVPFFGGLDSIKQHPLLQVSRQQIAVAGALVRKRKSAYWPKLQGTYGWQQIDGRSGFHSYQLGLSIPLFYGPERGRTQSAIIGRQIAEAQFEQAQLQLNAAYEQDRTKYWKWKTAWDYYRDEALPLAEKQKTGAVIAYQEGGIDYVTFLQNISNAIAVDVAAWKTFRQYLESRYRLDYYRNQRP